MCTMVRTRDVTVLLDAGVALGPRFRLMPHPLEYRALNEARERITRVAGEATVVTISHYHNDHHTPNFTDPVWLASSPEVSERTYRGKTVLVKDYRKKINTAQRRRGWMFKQAAEKWTEKLEAADGSNYHFGRTTIRFPAPVPHGEDESGLGWVLLAVVERSGEKFVFAPDVQGPIDAETVRLIRDEKPDMLIMGGPPTYLRGFKVRDEFFQTALQNMEKLASEIETLVIDHHVLRDEGWYDFLKPVRDTAERQGHQVLTAAELLKQECRPLEYRRKELYDLEKPSADFLKWSKLPKEKLNQTPPPL